MNLRLEVCRRYLIRFRKLTDKPQIRYISNSSLVLEIFGQAEFLKFSILGKAGGATSWSPAVLQKMYQRITRTKPIWLAYLYCDLPKELRFIPTCSDGDLVLTTADSTLSYAFERFSVVVFIHL